MKAIVAGFVLIALSLGAIVWHRMRETPPAANNAAAPATEAAERVTRCMVWSVRRGAATVWLCGSIHLLRDEDYPLPGPYEEAFAQARRIVTELPQGGDQERLTKEALDAAGTLPQGTRLDEVLPANVRGPLQSWAGGNGYAMEKLQAMKPWRAALEVGAVTAGRHGYRAALGVERHFAAKAGTRALEGLVTARHQFSFFEKIEPALQEQMILRALAEDSEDGTRRAARVHAWREGDTARLAELLQDSTHAFDSLHHLLFTERHAEWVPQIERWLEGSETVMVLVGAGHLAGAGNLRELLEEKGAALTQMEYRTRRPLPP